MKKYLVMVGMLFGFVALGYSGTPQEQGAQPTGSYSHSAIFGSTSTAVSTFGPSLSVAAASASNSGGLSVSYQNCFTKFIVQLSTGSTFSVCDGTSTVSSTACPIQISGVGLGNGSAYMNTISLPEDHLGPLCLTAGNTTFLTISTGTTAGISSVGSSISYEGYTTAGPGSNRN